MGDTEKSSEDTRIVLVAWRGAPAGLVLELFGGELFAVDVQVYREVTPCSAAPTTDRKSVV